MLVAQKWRIFFSTSMRSRCKHPQPQRRAPSASPNFFSKRLNMPRKLSGCVFRFALVSHCTCSQTTHTHSPEDHSPLRPCRMLPHWINRSFVLEKLQEAYAGVVGAPVLGVPSRSTLSVVWRRDFPEVRLPIVHEYGSRLLA